MTIPFSQARLYCEGDAVGPGGWRDGACPDITWSNPKINVNLIFNRDLTLSRTTAASTSGTFRLGGLNVISVANVNTIVTNLANNGVQKLIPTANRYISKFAKASVIARYARLPESCINLDYNNDNLKFSIPLRANCASALGLPAVATGNDSGTGVQQAPVQRLTLAKGIASKTTKPSEMNSKTTTPAKPFASAEAKHPTSNDPTKAAAPDCAPARKFDLKTGTALRLTMLAMQSCGSPWSSMKAPHATLAT